MFKIQDYKKSKAFDSEQKLDIIGSNNKLPKSCSQLHDIKILNFREYDEKLDLAIPYIKDKLLKYLKNLKI